MATAPQRVLIERTQQELALSVAETVGLWGSFIGLMLKSGIPARTGLVFRPAMGIHTFFMRFDLDLVYLDKQDAVTKVRSAMVPWRLDFTSAAACIELNAGEAGRAGVEVGDRLLFEPIIPLG